jgi:spoIIIJ-associated protein
MKESEIIKTAQEQTSEFLTQLGLDAEISLKFVESEVKDDVEVKYLFIKLESEHLAELIGFHGKVFDSMQNLLGLIISKACPDEGVRVLLEINDYRERREDYLKRYALRAAEEVRMNKQSMELPPMKPFERRIIHMALKDDPDLITESEGLGEERRIIIKSK